MSIHAGGARASWQLGSLAEARQAEGAGSDIVAVRGIEAGGHVRGTRPLEAIIGEAYAELTVPVVPAGGIGTNDDVVRSLDAGAGAVRCGTVFVAAAESAARDAYRQALIDATPEDTVITTALGYGWPDAAHRALRESLSALAEAPDIVGVVRERGVEIPLPRGATANPTRSTVGMLAAMPHYAAHSVRAVHAAPPAGDIVAELADTAT